MPRAAVRLRRTWPQRALLTLTSSAAVVALLTAGALWDLSRLNGRIERIPVSSSLDRAVSSDADVPGTTENYLLVGVDGSGGVRDEGSGPRRVLADSMMILRTHAGSSVIDVLPLPRDLWVEIAGHGSAKLNAAMPYGAAADPPLGGRRLLIETIRENLDIEVHHYVEVDFDGFTRIVDRVGGIALWFPAPTRDGHVGIDVGAPGCVALDAQATLDLARSRHYRALVDGRWRSDPGGDLGRIRRQQLILRAVLQKAFSQGARNPLTLRRILYDLADSVVLDDSLTLDRMVGLATSHRHMALDDLHTWDLTVTFAHRGGQSVDLLDDTAANRAALDHFREGPPATATTSTTVIGSVGSQGDGATSTTGAHPPAVPDAANPPDGTTPDPLVPFTPTLAAPDGSTCRS